MTGFLCPTCGAATQVIDSRPSPYGIRRRRSCACGVRFTTYERSDCPIVASAELEHARDQILAAQQAITGLIAALEGRQRRRDATELRARVRLLETPPDPRQLALPWERGSC